MLASKPIAVVANKRDLVEVRTTLPKVSLIALQQLVSSPWQALPDASLRSLLFIDAINGSRRPPVHILQAAGAVDPGVVARGDPGGRADLDAIAAWVAGLA